jgi:methionyl-tRNA formyltransferase
MRVVYLGSPEFAVPTLRKLAGDSRFEIALVVTQAAKGASPVELAANELKLPVFKPATLRDPLARARLLDAEPELFVVAAFGLILSRKTLAIPKIGAINVHPSLLPKYRGASPIMAAVLSGDELSGVSLMEMDANIDTGPVVSTVSEVVASDDTTASLGARLATIAAEQAARDIPRWANGELVAQPQSALGASVTRPLLKMDGLIDWWQSAVEIERLIRAMWPWPRAWTTVDGSPFQIHRARVVPESIPGHEPGSVLPWPRRIVVACGEGAIELLIVEPAGRRAMAANAYLNGRRTPLVRFAPPSDVPEAPPLIVPLGGAEPLPGAKTSSCG